MCLMVLWMNDSGYINYNFHSPQKAYVHMIPCFLNGHMQVSILQIALYLNDFRNNIVT